MSPFASKFNQYTREFYIYDIFQFYSFPQYSTNFSQFSLCEACNILQENFPQILFWYPQIFPYFIILLCVRSEKISYTKAYYKQTRIVLMNNEYSRSGGARCNKNNILGSMDSIVKALNWNEKKKWENDIENNRFSHFLIFLFPYSSSFNVSQHSGSLRWLF